MRLKGTGSGTMKNRQRLFMEPDWVPGTGSGTPKLYWNMKLGTQFGTRCRFRNFRELRTNQFCNLRPVLVVLSQDNRPQRSPVCERPLIFPDGIRLQTTPCSVCKRPHKADHLHPRKASGQSRRYVMGM